MKKSTVDEIRERFDVERFSNLETGQSATIDAPLSLTLIADAASCVTFRISRTKPIVTAYFHMSARKIPRDH